MIPTAVLSMGRRSLILKSIVSNLELQNTDFSLLFNVFLFFCLFVFFCSFVVGVSAFALVAG